MTSAIETQRAHAICVGAVVDELVRSGIRHFCVCPGSRSTPLAMTIARRPDARIWMHLDERSAAYFALGMAKQHGEPVALVCTSGTAAANFFPAVVEAHYARVPLVILTADRPHELRDNGAAQTIDQIHLYGRYAKWFVDLPEPQVDPTVVRFLRTTAGRAVATARRGPAGPVHLNWPFREPLVPAAEVEARWTEGRADSRVWVAAGSGPRAVPDELLNDLAWALERSPRGLLICGPCADRTISAAVSRLAALLDYPILADPLSGVRCGDHARSHVLDCYDAYLRLDRFAARYVPDVVVRFGAMPTSKPVLLYLERHPEITQIVVDGDDGWEEPTQRAQLVIHADPRRLVDALADRFKTGLPDAETRRAWLADWRRADRAARKAVSDRLDQLEELFEGKVFHELARLLPAGATIYAGNSMPVRDLDTFFPGSDRPVHFLANRGVNGIDGVVSSALGAAAAGARPLVLVIGDLSFYHDANGLLSARQHGLDATIVLVNNDGGGIFSFLPQAEHGERFEELFGTPHGLDFRPIAEAYGARFTRCASWAEFRSVIGSAIDREGLHVVELRTDRGRNVVLHREVWNDVAAALEREGLL